MKDGFSFSRLLAVMAKEFIQIKRDRPTFAMIIGIPLIQLTLFGFAINSNPRYLPTVLVATENTNITRSLLAGMENSSYFRFVKETQSEEDAKNLLQRGDVQFVVSLPPHFTRSVIRGERPAVLVEVDATDPAATSNAVAAVNYIGQYGLDSELVGPLKHLKATSPPIELRIHEMYNPLAITQYNVVPGLLGVVLTMTLVIITGLAMTRERERGTIENLLATPVKPIEVIIGKILPYIIIGYIQVSLIIFVGKTVFDLPTVGSILFLFLLCLPFIAANLSVGIMFSTLAKNQLQANQFAIFFFLPSLLLSGFMFPFRGMPEWAQVIGNLLPLTHFVVIVRGILLKGNGLINIWEHLWPILLFTVVVILIGLKRYKRTLD